MVVPSIRNIKISEDQSPRPQDRVYCMFNYFQGVNDQVNQRLRAPIGYTQVFRYIGGFEKTFLDGQGSIGFRQPLDTVTANSSLPRQFGNFGGTSTAVGDLEIIVKYILLEDRQSGSLLSGGLDVTAPTGPGRFAGFNSVRQPDAHHVLSAVPGLHRQLGQFLSPRFQHPRRPGQFPERDLDLQRHRARLLPPPARSRIPMLTA